MGTESEQSPDLPQAQSGPEAPAERMVTIAEVLEGSYDTLDSLKRRSSDKQPPLDNTYRKAVRIGLLSGLFIGIVATVVFLIVAT